MFEDYIQDAYSFYELGIASTEEKDERKAKMYFRASVFCAASSLEAFVNFIGNTFKQGNRLDKIEIAFLNDLSLEIAPNKASIEERQKYNSIESKIKFILKKFNVPLEISTASQWRDFLDFKEFRNGLIHNREISDENEILEYKNSISKGLNANIDIMNAISKKLFNNSLRQGLLDLKI